ncbi:LysR family transcriptional regulator [Umezawaea sp. NPDC059074]|uniref:LysR family transcriptional regulator n=1 Tax=Umezawaea sp. NPDC059074 TaxID=3346716 RepID=UPI00369C6E25
MLELRRLALLHQFSLRGTIAAVADATGYSASAVSQQLAVLEREVGVTLLERSARSAHLTSAGRRLAAHAATVLNAVEAAEADLASDTVSGRLVISTIPSAATAWSPLLVGLRQTHPALELVLRHLGPARALDALRSREVDIAIVDDWRPQPPEERDLHRHHLVDDPLLMIGDPSDGLWLCAPPDQPSRAATDSALTAAGITPVTRWEFEGLATIADLVAAGTGAALLPALAMSHRDLPTTPLKPPRHRRIDALTRTGSARLPGVVAVLAVLRAEGRALAR